MTPSPALRTTPPTAPTCRSAATRRSCAIYHQTEILAVSKRVKGYPDLSIRDALPWAHQIAVP